MATKISRTLTVTSKQPTYTPSAQLAALQKSLAAAEAAKPAAYKQSAQVAALQKSLAQTEAGKPAAYTPSAQVAALQKSLAAAEAKRPAAYKSAYQAQIDETLNRILNREDFSYNANLDPLYQQYKQQYVRQGQNAMRDTAAQAAELTGGYGSSYGTVAASQAYDAYLQQLNDRIPELYQLAMQKYNMEGENMRSNLSALQGQEDAAYGRYRDTVGDWKDERAYALGRYNTERDTDYDRYRDRVGDYQANRAYALDRYNTERDYGYGAYRDTVSDWWDAQQLAEQQAQAAQEQANWERQMALSLAKAQGGGSGRSSGGSKKSSSKAGTETATTNGEYGNRVVYRNDGQTLAMVDIGGGEWVFKDDLAKGLQNGTLKTYKKDGKLYIGRA